MWLCFNDSFVSVIEDHQKPEGLIVRARNPEHLKTLFPNHAPVLTPRNDYGSRVFVSRKEVADLVLSRIANLHYSNFKSSTRDDALHDMYSEFWSIHHEYQKTMLDG